MAHIQAGKKAPKSILENIPRLISSYYTQEPDVSIASQQVAFGTSGHRGTANKKSFNETHFLLLPRLSVNTESLPISPERSL